MHYIYLLSAVVFSAMLSIMGVLFNTATKGTANISALYNFVLTASAFSVWGIICLFNSEFSPEVLSFSLVYGVFYSSALIGLFGALKNGSVSLTSFIKQLSLVGTAMWGFLFWNTPFNTNIAIGMVLIVAAIYFCFKPDAKDNKTVTLKWLFYVALLFVGNSGCSIIQKYQQIKFGGKYGSFFMFFACGFSAIMCLIIYLQGTKTKILKIKKSAWKFPIMAGISSALLNLFIFLLASSTLSPSVIYPSIAVGGVMLTILFSVTVCKEKLSQNQCIGLCTGMIAIAFLNSG